MIGNPPSVERLKGLFHYESSTGTFRLTGPRGGYPAGWIVGTKTKEGYLVLQVDGVRHFAHRLAWLYEYGEWPSMLDHVNRRRDDNRIVNLRLATQSQNNANAALRSDNSTGHKGVTFDRKRGKYRAYIVKDGKQYHLGRFEEFLMACAAYRNAAIEFYGEFV